jgi:hypothetical protein
MGHQQGNVRGAGPTKLYDRTSSVICLGDIERILI